jgi:hypothetical protein
MMFLDQPQGGFPVAGLADDPQAGVGFNDVAQTAAKDRVVVGDQDAELLAHESFSSG